jgi:hypothetical protein
MGYIPRSEAYIPRFLQGTIVLGTVVSYVCYLEAAARREFWRESPPRAILLSPIDIKHGVGVVGELNKLFGSF